MTGRMFSALAVAALAGSAVYAQADMSPAEKVSAAQNALDPNRVTTRDDARDFARKEFLLADVNNDGKLSKPEFTAFAASRMKLINTVTAPGSPSLEPKARSEMGPNAQAPEAETLQVYDPAERAEASESQAVSPDAVFAELSGGKQTVSRQELIDARVEIFDKADADGDGALDAQENRQFAELLWSQSAS